MSNRQKPLILIVDDNPVNLQVLRSILKKNDYALAATQNGFEALDLAKNKHPDLILLDIVMSEIDGFEVCKRLQNDADTKQIPVIFLTGKTDSQDIVTGFEVGGVDYVTKPFNAAELLARVRTQIKLKQAFDEIKILKGFISICANCKRIRDDDGYWENVEVYIESHTEALFTHSVCQDCEAVYRQELAAYMKEKKAQIAQ